MSRQQRRRRLDVPAEIHAEPQRFLDAVFGGHVEAVVRDQTGRWGVVLAGSVAWLGTEAEIRSFDLLRRRLVQLGVRVDRPPSIRYGRWVAGALRRLHNQQRRQHQ